VIVKNNQLIPPQVSLGQKPPPSPPLPPEAGIHMSESIELTLRRNLDAKVPCLGVDWHEDATQVFTGCTSGEVKGFALHRNQGFEIGSHEGIVKDVYWLKATNILCSVSLDRTVRFWDLRERGPVYQFELKYEPLYSDLYEHKLALALSENKVTLVDLAEGLKTKDSQE